MARVTSRADRRGGPTSRGSPSVLPMRLSHKPPSASAVATRAANRPAFLGFIEDMKAAAVKNELEWTLGWGNGKEIQRGETASETATIQFRIGSFDRERGDIDAQDLETALRQPDRIGPCTGANLQRPRGRNATRSDEFDEQRLRLASVPGKLSCGITLVPQRVRHASPTSLAPNRTGSAGPRYFSNFAEY